MCASQRVIDTSSKTVVVPFKLHSNLLVFEYRVTDGRAVD